MIRGFRCLEMIPSALAVTFVACIDNAILPGDKSVDQVESGSADTATPRECDTGDEGAGVEVRATCSVPAPDWSLRVRWQLTLETTLMAVSTGRLGDTDGDGVVTSEDGVAIWLTKLAYGNRARAAVLLDATGTTLWQDDQWEGAHFVASTVGTLAPGEPPAQFIMARPSADHAYLTAVSDGEPQYTADLGNLDVDDWLWLLDVEEDGVYELVGAGLAVHARNGTEAYPSVGSSLRPVAADLNLDGTSEVLTVEGESPLVHHPVTGEQSPCPVDLDRTESPVGNAALAVGNFDEDAEGEFVACHAGIVAICDAEGTLMRHTTVEILYTDAIGLGQFDRDEAPEVLIGQTLPDASATVVIALDTDLSPLWTTQVGEGGSHLPFALADLDGDGRHEVIVRRNTGVSVLSADGEILADLPLSSPDAGAMNNPVIVTDIDGDGRAEILVGGMDPNLVVIDNAAGGWPVRGSQDWWPGMDHFPGDRAMDGSLPSGSARHWLAEGGNVWQGLAAGPPDLPDLGVEAQACSEDCETTRIVASVANHGRAEAPGPIVVEVARTDGTVLASTSIASAPSGSRIPVELRIPTAEATGELVVRATGRWVECVDVANEARLSDLPCG